MFGYIRNRFWKNISICITNASSCSIKTCWNKNKKRNKSTTKYKVNAKNTTNIESFSDLNGVIEKYRVLEDKYNEIKKETDSAKIQKEKEKVKFREEKSKLESQINGLITNIQSVQGQLKELKEKKKNLENEVTMMEANSNTVVSSLEMILLAIDNIYEKCSKKNNWTQHGDAKEFSKFDVDIKDKKKAYHQRVQEAKTKIKYINNYIQDYVKITEDYKKAKKLQQQQNQGK